METIQLYAPNDLQIIGILAEDGSIFQFDYSYDNKTQTRLYVLKERKSTSETTSILIDSDGNKWNSEDVEWHTLFKHR